MRFANVAVLCIARLTGSPSLPASSGYPSTSSMNRYLIGIERNPTAEFAPVSINTPPGNSLSSIVLPLSLDLGSLTLSRKIGQFSIAGSIRIFELRLDVSTVGLTISIGPGA